MSDEKKGYKNPPKRTRFKPGTSGNPSGRPKGRKSFSTLFEDTVSEIVTIQENGTRKNISKLEASLKQLVNKAASGDHKSICEVLRIKQCLDTSDIQKEVQNEVACEADRQIISSIINRVKISNEGNS